MAHRRGWSAAVVAGVMVVATGARTATPVSAAYPEEAVAFGGGRNIVNVTLVDIRAWDTLGEISVLVAAATGVASLIFLGTRSVGRSAESTDDRRQPDGRAADRRRGVAARRPRRSPRSGARSSSRWSPGWSSTPSSCSRSTCCSPGTTSRAAASPAAWSPAWRWSCATSPAAGTSSTRRRRSTPACCWAPACSSPPAPALAPLASAARCCRAPWSTCTCRCSATSSWSPRCSSTSASTCVVVGLVLDVLRSLGAEIDRQIVAGGDRRAAEAAARPRRWPGGRP